MYLTRLCSPPQTTASGGSHGSPGSSSSARLLPSPFPVLPAVHSVRLAEVWLFPSVVCLLLIPYRTADTCSTSVQLSESLSLSGLRTRAWVTHGSCITKKSIPPSSLQNLLASLHHFLLLIWPCEPLKNAFILFILCVCWGRGWWLSAHACGGQKGRMP